MGFRDPVTHSGVGCRGQGAGLGSGSDRRRGGAPPWSRRGYHCPTRTNGRRTPQGCESIHACAGSSSGTVCTVGKSQSHSSTELRGAARNAVEGVASPRARGAGRPGSWNIVHRASHTASPPQAPVHSSGGSAETSLKGITGHAVWLNYSEAFNQIYNLQHPSEVISGQTERSAMGWGLSRTLLPRGKHGLPQGRLRSRPTPGWLSRACPPWAASAPSPGILDWKVHCRHAPSDTATPLSAQPRPFTHTPLGYRRAPGRSHAPSHRGGGLEHADARR